MRFFNIRKSMTGAKAFLEDLEPEEISIVDVPAVQDSMFRIRKAKMEATLTGAETMECIGHAMKDGFCLELIEGNRAIVRSWDEAESGFVTKSVPYTVEGTTVMVDEARATRVKLAWANAATVKKSVESAPRPTGFMATVARQFGFTGEPSGIGAAIIPEEDSMTPDEIRKAVEEALAPISARLDKIENPEPVAKSETPPEPTPEAAAEPTTSEPVLTLEDVKKALTEAISPVTDRVARLETARGISSQPADGSEPVEKKASHLFAGIFA